MPVPGQQNLQAPDPAQQRMLAAIAGTGERPATQADVQALAAVVADLVALLQPPSAVILTGAEAARAFAELRRSGPKSAAQMRYDAKHDPSCVGAFARARP